MQNPTEHVTVVNRTSKELQGTWNGRPYKFPANGQITLPKIVAVASRFQNPVMGRGTPMEDWNTKSEYLLAIVELGDDVTPIEQTNEPQRWDTELVNGMNTQIVRPRVSYEAVRQNLPTTRDGGFVKP